VASSLVGKERATLRLSPGSGQFRENCQAFSQPCFLPPAILMQREQRLRRNQDFQRVRRLGQSRTNPMAVLAFLPNNLEHSRVGFVVSKRIGGAVQRNRIKRQMREAVRLQWAALKPGFDLVFIARQPVKMMPYAEMAQTIKHLLKSAGLLCKQEQVE
jgi:ribonuclease P protein component